MRHMSQNPFAGIIGHEPALRILTHALAHPAQAYLFAGPEGVGKRLVAERFVRALLNHPTELPLAAHADLTILAREEGAKEITVKQTRELMVRMQMTSAHGGKKVALILGADRMNEEAGNALLKAVEEPPPNTIYLFLAEQPERLPGTLRSRLVTIPFGRVPRACIVAWLVARGYKPEESLEVATLAHGAPGLALRWLEEGSEWRSSFLAGSRLLQTLQTSPVGVQCAALERIAKSCESTEDAEAAWRVQLGLFMRAWSVACPEDPAAATRVGLGLLHAWRLAGTSLSPRLGLEWSAVQPYSMEDAVPTFLQTSYL